MSYGRLSDAQKKTLRPHVEGKTVHDLGAGQCELTLELLTLGAKKVVAVDKEAMPPIDDKRVTQVRAYFDAFDAKEIDVAFISYPANRNDGGLLALVVRAKTVVYVGKNTDGTACGWPTLFLELGTRKILAYEPEKKNVLIVYSDELEERDPRGEEYAGLTMNLGDKALTFDEAEQHVRDRKRISPRPGSRRPR